MRDGVPRAPYINPRDRRPYEDDRKLTSTFRKEEGYKEERAIIEKEIVLQKKKWVKIKEERLKALRLLGSELIGNIFERVKFLETRINDIETSFKSRQLINQSALEEITEDISEKTRTLSSTADSETIRDLQLDLTNLKMERRREILIFWKDKFELKKELQELKEQHAIESKVAKLFEGLINGVPD